ncbi:MAG: carbon-nitrogen hydrolase family protein [Thermoguttaceae bacterium]
MSPTLIALLAAVLAAVGIAPKPPGPGACEEQVRNGNFASGKPGRLSEAWAIWGPESSEAACRVRLEPQGLLMDSPQEPFAVGGVWQQLKPVEAGQAYAIEAVCVAAGLKHPYRSLAVRLTWTRGGKPLHPAGMLVRGPVAAGGKLVFQDVLVAPQEADGAKLALEAKWLQGGSVLWQHVSVRPTDPPKPRRVRIGTVYLRPSGSTPERNLELFCEQIDAAGRWKLDIVCLPEAITLVGTSRTAGQVAEPIPGPSTERLAQAARKNGVWVVAGLYERDGQRVYNTAVLLDREGRLAGTYRKTHLPREEWQKGVVPGHQYPVFKTDFGTVAIQICYDWFFPEVAAIFSLQGAEILFAPTWGTTFADQQGRAEGETVFRVRARDNGLYLVPSVYDGQSMVIDPMGRILAANQGKTGVFWAEVDLNQREPLWWVGYWRSIAPRDRMPETYAPLLTDPAGPTY